MSAAPLRRTQPAPPVRHVHLGLGAFFRAHQAWYTAHADDAAEWGIAAFTGRSRALADTLTAQDGLYTLAELAPGADHVETVESVVAAHAGTDHEALLRYAADAAVTVMTTTVTEAGYVRGASGIDHEDSRVAADVATLRADPRAPVQTAPARIVAFLLARRAAGGGGLTIVPCDNLPSNGDVLRDVVEDLTSLVDPSLQAWADEHLSYVTTMVDRITPASTDDDVARARAAGFDDAAPVATEPFAEWVLAGEFRGPHPAWETAGATFTDDVVPYEERKLFLLNGAHSLLAYAGSARGHETVAEAFADPLVRSRVEAWWDEACRHLTLPAGDLAAYRVALTARFANTSIRHLLAQIAKDGTQKLPVRILPTLRRERTEGRMPDGAVAALAAWIASVRAGGPALDDPLAERLRPLVGMPADAGSRDLLALLDPALAQDAELVRAVVHAQVLVPR
ncbi:mannitol dehydrogenase family protein [Sanguibacter hominis]|uniref:mannitol dehydrogenase family protein n=1 Tax=Sanguibacter hominis TaxID=1312739 RepID=UPI003306E87E